MNDVLTNALAERLLATADDELILGHRNSEWCGHAPILEEDIAFANIALDEIGHAGVWYAILANLLGEDDEAYPDRLAFHRDAGEFRCVQVVARPKGDWAFSMLRQYLFDVYETTLYGKLAASSYTPVMDAAVKIVREEAYHRRHTQMWVKRLGLGTEESNRRMQTALDALWGGVQHLFAPLPGDAVLADKAVFPSLDIVKAAWQDEVIPFLQSADLIIPQPTAEVGSRGEPSPYLEELLAEMQKVARLNPAAKW